MILILTYTKNKKIKNICYCLHNQCLFINLLFSNSFNCTDHSKIVCKCEKQASKTKHDWLALLHEKTSPFLRSIVECDNVVALTLEVRLTLRTRIKARA